MNQSNQTVVLPGKDGIITAYEKALESTTMDIVCFSAQYEQVVGQYFDRDNAPRLYEASRKTREILPDTAGNHQDSVQKGKNHLVKFIKTSAIESDMILTDTSVTYISFDLDSPCAIVITDKGIVKSVQTQFDELWSRI